MLIFEWFTLDPTGSAAIVTRQRLSGPPVLYKILFEFLQGIYIADVKKEMKNTDEI